MNYRYENNDYLALVSEDEVNEFEVNTRLSIPTELRNFLLVHGCGFIEENMDECHRLFSPREMIDFMNFSNYYSIIEDKDFFKSINGKGFVFMEYAQETFFWISIENLTYGKIYYYDDCIAESFNDLINKMHNREKVY